MKRLNCQQTRRHYEGKRLSITEMLPDPVEQFIQWYREIEHDNYPDTNAMVLSTVDKEGMPDSRVVLLKEIDDNGFVFYTNYNSEKGQQLARHPKAALNFYWPQPTRQVRIRGNVSHLSAKRSAAYFASRDRISQLSVYASEQSKAIMENELEQHLQEANARFVNQDIPCPAFWGGYCIEPICIEFFQGQSGRLHDRIRYTKQPSGSWFIERLSP